MKRYKICLNFLIAFTLSATASYAQDVDTLLNPMSYIKTTGRYSVGKGIELRFFPDNKSILETGFKYGYVIDRMLYDTTMIKNGTDSLKYVEIATISPYTDTQWESLIDRENDLEEKNNLMLGFDFINNISNKTGGSFSLENGIAELNEQKSKEDFEYLVFALTALKSKNTAFAMGLAFTDSSVVEGNTYVYRVRPIGKSDIYTIIPVDYIIFAEELRSGYKNEVEVKQGDGELFFSWLDDPELSGYFIERADPGKTTYTQLNKAPIYKLEGSTYIENSKSGYHDKNLINYQIYKYRFFGYTLFGEKVQFAEVQGMAKDLTPPQQPFLPQPKHVKPNEVLIKWEMIPNPAADLKGFFVGRGTSNEGQFTLLHDGILPKSQRSFIDTSFIRGQYNYYIVQAIDTANNISSSFPVSVALIDSTPPSKPLIISGIIDSLGIVTITITKNPESDLMGYRLYTANDIEHEFSAIQEAFKVDNTDTSAIKLVFADTVTLRSLTPKIYYRIKALDFNYNQSVFSEIIAVVRPDTIPPVTPVITDVAVGETQIQLYFVLSESIDVREHILYRKTDLEDEWQVVLLLDSTHTTVIDTNVQTGTTYYYSLRAVDHGNLFSGYAHSVYGKPYDTGVRPPVENFTGSIEEEKAQLTWDYPVIKDKEVSFVIYKQNREGHLIQYKHTADKTIIDPDTNKENVYAIKAVTTDGGQSSLSDVISVVKSE